MIGKGDDRGRWFLVAIAGFAFAAEAAARLTSWPRDTVQTYLVIALFPVAFWSFWSLRDEKGAPPAETPPDAAPSEPASSTEV